MIGQYHDIGIQFRFIIENKGQIVYNYPYDEKIKIRFNHFSPYAVR